MVVLLAEAVRTLGVNGPMEWYHTHLILLFVSYSFIKDLVQVLANIDNAVTYSRGWGGGGGRGTPLYKPYRYVPPQSGRVLRRLGLKTGIHFAHFGLESSMVFEVTTRVYERIYRFNSK